MLQLSQQIEALAGEYERIEERVDIALALVKPEGFTKELDANGAEVYTAEIIYPKDRERLLLASEAMRHRNPGLLSLRMHRTPLGQRGYWRASRAAFPRTCDAVDVQEAINSVHDYPRVQGTFRPRLFHASSGNSSRTESIAGFKTGSRLGCVCKGCSAGARPSILWSYPWLL